MTRQQAETIMRKRNSPEDRFVLRALAITRQRGGLPTTTIEDGRIVFTYPDGTRTVSGVPTKA